MSESTTLQDSPARVAGRRLGAIVRIAIQVAGIVMVWGDISDRFADVILTVVWVYVPFSLIVGWFLLCRNLQGSKINDCSVQQVTGHFFHFVSRRIDRQVLFAAFLLSMYAYGETTLAMLCLVTFVILFLSHLAYTTKDQKE